MDLSANQTLGRASSALPQLLERLEQQLSRRWVIIALNLIVLALLAYSVAQWTWRLLTPAATEVARPVAVIDNPAEYDLSALLSANIFGQAPLPAGRTSLENIPLSSLNLVLSGVFASPNGAIALISADGAPEAPFAVGQEIVAGASLHAVHPDRVLIQRGGATETLMLKDATASLPSGSITPAPSASPARPTATASTSAPTSNTAITAIGSRNYRVDRAQITQQMQQPEFLAQALMVPHAEGGFLIREIQPGSLYEKLGLRVGDVIKNVNGQPGNSVDDVMRLYQQFGTAASVNMKIRRSGKNQTFNYSIQ